MISSLMLVPILALGAEPAPAAPEAPVLTLERALQEAREHNVDLRTMAARLQQAQELHRKVVAGYLPTVSLSAGYTRNSHGAEVDLPRAFMIRNLGTTGTTINNPQGVPAPGIASPDVLIPYNMKDIVLQKENQLGAEVALKQVLIAPALWSAIDASKRAERTAEWTVQAARRELLFGVAQLYYGSASLRHAVEVHEKLVANHLARERDAANRVAAGAAPRLALIRAQIDRTRAEQDLRRARNAYASAKLALGTLLDRSEPFEVQDPGPAPAATAENERRLPAVEAARSGVDAARAARRATLGKYAPNLGLQAAYRVANLKGFVDSYTSWYVTLGLNWTLWDGGLRESEDREARAKIVEAESALRSQELKAREDADRARLDLESARANLTKAEEQLRLARENMSMIDANDKAGVATQLEVSDASTALAAAELNVVAERLNADLASLRLQKALGAFAPE